MEVILIIFSVPVFTFIVILGVFIPLVVRVTLPTLFSRATFVMPIVYKYNLGTPALQRFLIDLMPSTPLKKLRDISDTMHHHSLKLVNEKKEALAKGSGDFKNDHKDILSILSKFIPPLQFCN